MIDYLKQRKIVIIIGILAIILVGWKIYDSKNFEQINSDDIMVSSSNDDKKEIVENEDEEEEMMAVHITGEVKNPGVVRVKEGSRIQDIIEKAGGLTENADITDVNLAYVVEDGMKVRIQVMMMNKARKVLTKMFKKKIITPNIYIKIVEKV